MRLLKKLNRGFVLTLAVIIAVSAYLVYLNAARKSDRSEIEKLNSDFFAAYSRVMTLPDAVMAKEGLKEKDFDALAAENMKELKTYFADNELCGKYTQNALSDIYEKQYTAKKAVAECTVTVARINNYNFNADFASADVSVNVIYSGPASIRGNIGETSSDRFSSSESMAFQKTDSGWKIFYFTGQIMYGNDKFIG